MSRKLGNKKSKFSEFLGYLLFITPLSQKQLSKIAKVNPSVFHDWLTGSHPSENIKNVKILANYFGYTLSEALTGSEDKLTRYKNFHQ